MIEKAQHENTKQFFAGFFQKMKLRRFFRRILSVLMLLFISPIMLPAAMAYDFPYDLPPPATLTTPFGTLQVSGGADGYLYSVTGTDHSLQQGPLGGQKPAGANGLNALIDLDKPSGLLQFNLLIGASPSITPGAPLPVPSFHAYSSGPVEAGYVTISPSAHIQISGGQVFSLEGYESGVGWKNTTDFTTSLFYVENAQSNGISLLYTQGNVSISTVYGDGFDTGVWNFVQASVNWNVSQDHSLNMFYATNISKTGLATHIYGSSALPYSHSTNAGYGAYYDNSTLFGGFYDFQDNNLNVVPELQYVYAKSDHTLGLTKSSSNFGAALFINYDLENTPYLFGSWLEYFSSQGSDNWFINPGASGWGAAGAVTWQHRYLFVRPAIALIQLENSGSGPAYGKNDEHTQFNAILSAGFAW